MNAPLKHKKGRGEKRQILGGGGGGGGGGGNNQKKRNTETCLTKC